MANQNLLELLKQGANEWNSWRGAHLNELATRRFYENNAPDGWWRDDRRDDRSGANLAGFNLSEALLSGVNLSGGIFRITKW